MHFLYCKMYCYLTIIIVLVTMTAGFGPSFYPCDYQGQIGSMNLAQGHLSISIDGNPASYQPGLMYHVSLNSGSSFNILVITGVIASQPGEGSQCFPIHTHMSPDVVDQVSFYWIAPPSGSGCVSMILRASLRQQTVFDDVVGFQICEEGMIRPQLVDLHTSGVIFRDDFDSGPMSRLWNSEWIGVEQGKTCQVMHGKAAVFCDMTSNNRHLITGYLDMRNASSLQFMLGAGSCPSSESRIMVSYRDTSVTYEWALLKRVKAPPTGHPSHVYVSNIPDQVKTAQVEIKFSEDLPDSGAYVGCWAIDNVLITSELSIPSHIEDHMDPIEISNWLFAPGSSVESTCSSDGNAIIMTHDATPTYVTTRDIDLSEGAVSGIPVLEITSQGGTSERGGCGHSPDKIVKVFDKPGTRSYCTSPDVDLSDKVAASFTLSIGSGSCSRSRSHKGDVQYYYVTDGIKHVTKIFHYDAFNNPQHVVVPVPARAQSRDSIICLSQKSQSESENTWAIDSFELISHPNDHHYFAQFSINLACDEQTTDTRVKLQYSTDFGRSWAMLQNECLPETCPGKHWAQNSVYELSDFDDGWRRVIVPLPIASLASMTRFRWRQTRSNITSQWAIDDVYIGSDGPCPNMCSGRGSCSFEGCRCDEGYSGSSCDEVLENLPNFLSDDFNSERINDKLFQKASGAEIGFSCGILGSGKSLVFNGAERRLLMTKPLNATGLRFVQFTILIGRTSSTGTCKPPTSPGEGVLVQYSTNGGILWEFLDIIPFDSYHAPRIISLRLPPEAMTTGLQVRWFQPSNKNGAGHAVWAIDDVLVTSKLFKTAYSPSVNFHLGAIQPYCNRSLVLAFTTHGPPHERQVRYAETQSLQITQGYVLQAEVVIGCREPQRDLNETSLANIREAEINTSLEVQYSTNHGRTWDIVMKLSAPGTSTSQLTYHAPSIFYASEHRQWERAILPLPENTWSDGTRFRIAQYNFDDRVDSWAVDNVYMGPACPLNCRNHGVCRNGVCMCDVGYHGVTCLPNHNLPVGFDVTFDDVDRLLSSGWRIFGGHVVGTGDEAYGWGCDPMTSSNYLHFDTGKVRKLQSPDIDTSGGGQIQFYLQIGGGKCDLAHHRNNGILLQYSIDGGTTWWLIQEFYYSDYPTPSYVHLDVPEQARHVHTRFRWWQPDNEGENVDRWSIDDVIVGERLQQDASFDDVTILPRAAGLTTRDEPMTSSQDLAFVMFSNRGESEDFCSQRPGSYVFNKLKGDRFALTDDLNLNEGDTIQFQINIGCSRTFSYRSPVRLEYSHDGGYTWDVIRHACYPRGRYLTRDDTMTHTSEDVTSHLCTGSARELSEASRYHKGDYDVWTTIIIQVPGDVAAEPVRFRWFQYVPLDGSGEVPADWAIANVYIGSSCPLYCSGHGLCTNQGDFKIPTCSCDQGYYENDIGSCTSMNANPPGFWDEFTELGSWWRRPLGGGVGSGCDIISDGNSLYFNGSGTRKAETRGLDTRHIRLIHFHLRIGGTDESCMAPSGREENIVFQYSLDGGISWTLIKEFNFEAFREAHAPPIIIDMPFRAKSSSTIFRWWQPTQGEADVRASWGLDDVIIGRSDRLSNGFYDDFEEARALIRPSQVNWYKLKGGRMGDYEGCALIDTSQSRGNSVVFDREEDGTRYIETWDLFILPGSFLQFDLIMGCSSDFTQSDVIRLEYSSDLGGNWHPVAPQCFPDSDVGCDHGLGTFYYHSLNEDWTRHTIVLPDVIRKPRVRFRWVQHYHSTSRWAIDHVYIGNDCEWMCSGFGYCQPANESYACRCDVGYTSSPHCQPSVTINSALKDDFNQPWSRQGKFGLEVGRDAVTSDGLTSVGVIVSRENLQFSRAGVRMLQTLPLNTSDVRYMQFYVMFHGEDLDFRNPASVIVQSSVNNGITWSTLEVIGSNFDDINRLIHIKLPKKMQQPSVIFRWWQADFNSNENEGVWALDNLAIGGRVGACEPYSLVDNFQNISDSDWLFYPGGLTGGFCEVEPQEEVLVRSLEPLPPDARLQFQNSVLSFNAEVGEHSVITRDLCVTNDNYVIQFKIAIGCGSTNASSEHAVKLEFSLDDGVTWDLVVPHCHGNRARESGCSDERHPASIYYPGSYQGWRMVVVPLRGRNHICDANSVRFRWYQGYYNPPVNDVITWAIDDVYIGPQCDQMCNGHGYCDAGSETCICDDGYEGDTCCDVIEDTNPTFFRETFDEESLTSLSASQLWTEAAGGYVTSSQCDGWLVFLRNNYVMTEPGSRILTTRDIDTRTAAFVQFYIKQGSDWEQQGTYETIEPIYFQFSTDGGLSWVVMETFDSIHIGQAQYVALFIPEHARSNATRFRWWEPSVSGIFTHQWALDHVIIGSNFQKIDDDFSTFQQEVWLELSSAEITTSSSPRCCSSDSCQFLNIGNYALSSRDCGRRWAATSGTRVGPGSFIHFNLVSDCEGNSNECHEIVLEFSSDLGHAWSQVQPPCFPSNPQCTSTHPGTVFTSDQFIEGKRVVLPLPEHTWSPSTRFRWRMPDAVDVMTWSIDDVYIGNECPSACSGHGRCHHGLCECDDGWSDPWCRTSTSDLITELKDLYEVEEANLYASVVGAVEDDSCGDMGYGRALHFNKACSRYLATNAMNLTAADFIQFMFRFGCDGTNPTNRDQGVMVDYTRNGGVTWTSLMELYYADYSGEARFVNILLPPRAKVNGVQIRWWQPTHNGERSDDWAIDNLFIGGKEEEKLLSDGFVVDPLLYVAPEGLYLDRDDVDMWQFYDNTAPTSFCGRDDVILAGVQSNLEASVRTKDFVAKNGYILQYTIVVLCEDIQKPHQPVHVQYSVDFGDSWQYVTSQCLPSDPDCFGKEMTQPTAHFISPDWRRRTVWLTNDMIERPLRFRLHQYNSDVVWALDQLYIGPACDDACSGHGDCAADNGDIHCVCDDGYGEPNCYPNTQQKTYLKDTFNDGATTARWNLVEAEKFNNQCGQLIDGLSLKFDGVGPRQAESDDLDLRDARFVQYHAVIGSNTSTDCLPSTRRLDGLLLQYSTNGGITWGLLRELDYQSYPNSTHDYVNLPIQARTNSTRLRWWQPFIIDPNSGLALMGNDRAGWAIDDVFIGGHEVNAPDLQDDLEEGDLPEDNIWELSDEVFEFYPNGIVNLSLCGGDVGSRLIMWPGGDEHSVEQSLTTRQLIVSHNYMIQFKIKVGCGLEIDECSRDFGVHLQYRKSIAENWRLVLEECFPDTPVTSSCIPFMHHRASIYTLHRGWSRITIPLDVIESGTTQFRWYQEGGSPSEYSWALDEIYIGEACPLYCSGHGKCVIGPRCICDLGFEGSTCSHPQPPMLIRDFKDHFELPTPIEGALAAASLARGAKLPPKKWKLIEGGEVGFGGCGSLRPHGFGRTAYFSRCGQRWLQTVEMDLRKGSYVQYVMQIGMSPSRPSCHVNFPPNMPRGASVLLEYTINNGVTWHLLQEHRPDHFTKPKRVAIKFGQEMKSVHTMIRWWQPNHSGAGQDQWAVDNIEIIMSRVNRHMHNLNAPPPLLSTKERLELPERPSDGTNMP